ncbi:phosphoglucomutase-2 [Plasmodium sp. DRC-Itaito]|uniref:Serine/threonine-protein phosphatase PGAM5, mitochondrial n=2 Tax=Plasmodium gaboni TaxID=647221 RepID=A0ABY1UHZ1_9APIC|nr:phosphoglucomutase-2 [Plasmodium sp. gorilla clade G2]SOV11294.1 phosphoglucomutase-2 [Plasmodium gaboni]SOV11388.1 phosphoglucomutase-2 [Plasmodium sp. gorilla clade G2]SOV21105.1 phosphoglucomutase-2 [Plasmodium sp. DRC-Itaito]
MFVNFFNKLNIPKSLRTNFNFKRRFSETKQNIQIKYIKENKKKYVFYTAVTSLSLSIALTYAYEKFVLYKWNRKYDYYYNPNIKFFQKKEKKEGKKDKKNTTKHIILVRHGQYERRYKDDETSKRLTKEGCKQADITGKKLKDILNNKKVSVIYHSDMIRAKETANIISKYFPDANLINDPNLNEGTPYLPDPLPRHSKFDAQKIKEDNKRINKAYETYFYKPSGDEDEYQLVICHGNVIRYFLCRALQIPLFAWLRFSSYNCGITWLVLDDEGSVVLREFGSVSHLPFESVTYF